MIYKQWLEQNENGTPLEYIAWCKGKAQKIVPNLMYEQLRGANLAYANLTGANLRGAILRGANLIDANLTGANLTGANLRGANLTDAKLTGVNLKLADLTGVQLENAVGIVTVTGVGSVKRAVYFIQHENYVMAQAGCFWGTSDELIAKAYLDSKSKGDEYKDVAEFAIRQLNRNSSK